MNTPSPLVVGQSVTRGQYVGPVGSTGNSTGSHLHIEIRLYGSSVDPLPYIQNAPLAGSTTPPTPTPFKEVELIGIWNSENTNEATRRAIVGELTFQVVTPAQTARQWPLWGTKNVTQAEWNVTKDLVNQRRVSAGLPTV